MSVLQQGLIVVDGYYNLTSDVCNDITIDAKNDTDAGIYMAIQALVSVLWWIITMFVYIENDNEPLLDTAGQASFPLGVMWAGILDVRYGWTSAAWLANFFIYGSVSVPELVAWALYLTGDNEWFGWWVTGYGWWGSVFLMTVPVVFSSLQLALPTSQGGFANDESVDYGLNAVFLISVGTIVYIQSAMMHILMAARVKCYVLANPLMQLQEAADCPLIQKPGQSKEDFDIACAKILKFADHPHHTKARMAVAAGAADTEDEETAAGAEAAAGVEEVDEKEEGNAWI